MSSIKKNDIVSVKVGVEQDRVKARVNWCEDGEVGVTYIERDEYKGGCSVKPEEDCEVLIKYKGDSLERQIEEASDDDIAEAIARLRGQRFPKSQSPTRGRRTSAPKQKSKAKIIDEIMNEAADGAEFDRLMEEARKEGGRLHGID